VKKHLRIIDCGIQYWQQDRGSSFVHHYAILSGNALELESSIHLDSTDVVITLCAMSSLVYNPFRSIPINVTLEGDELGPPFFLHPLTILAGLETNHVAEYNTDNVIFSLSQMFAHHI
jgi:hypothetical protein